MCFEKEYFKGFQESCLRSVCSNSKPEKPAYEPSYGCWGGAVRRPQVHAYTAAAGGRTAYLSELATGHTVTVADADGRTRPALVGRCKVAAPQALCPPHH